MYAMASLSLKKVNKRLLYGLMLMDFIIITWCLSYAKHIRVCDSLPVLLPH